MSTKFNRNHAEAGNDKFYHDDHKAELNGVEQDHFEDIQDFEELPCIVSGLDLAPEDYPSTVVAVDPGTARDQDGNRVTNPEMQFVDILNTSGGNNYVILSHKFTTDTPRNAYSSGVSYDTRIFDDYELTVAETYEAGDIVLGNVKVIGGVNLLYFEERTHPVYKPASGDTTPPTDPANLTLTSGIMGDTGVPVYADNYVARAERLAWLKAAWDASVDYGSGLAGYEIFLIPLSKADVEQLDKREDRKVRYSASDPRTDITFQNLTPGVKYRIKIRAVDKAGNLSAFDSADIIAGGAKQIPDTCADLLDGNPVITADDDGIRISWAIKSEYVDKICGIEICYTDDGTTPDFANKNHRRIFSDRNICVLPAKMSSDDVTVTVKAKMRGVDVTGQHCTTPKTLDDTPAKKYPADLAAVITDYKSIIDPGDFPTLKDFISKAINLADGRLKGITEVESYMAELSGDFPTPGARLQAVLQGKIDWKYVRIIAKEGGHYASLSSMIGDLPEDKKNPYTALMCPGVFNEGEIDLTGKQFSLNILGLQNVVIKGNIIRSTGSPWMPIENIENVMLITETAKDCIDLAIDEITAYRKTLRLKDCIFLQKYTSAQKVLDIIGWIYHVVIDHCYMELTQGLDDNVIELGGTNSTLKLSILNNSIIKNKSASAVATGLVQCEGSNWDVSVFDSIFCGHTSTPCIYTDVATALLKMSECRYTKEPSWAGTANYGAVHNVSNTKFAATADLDLPMPWEPIVT